MTPPTSALRPRFSHLKACVVAALLLGGPLAHAELQGMTRIASGFTSPVYATHAPGDPNRLFIVEQRGLIRTIDLRTENIVPTPFLDIQSLVDDQGNEQGLLGLAFDPDFQTNGHFYVNYTRDPTPGAPGLDRTRIDRFTAADPATSTTVSAATRSAVLEFNQDFDNHNAGWIGFSPVDGHLYIPTGDGGSGNDPNNRGQSLNTLLGKVLRIDPTGDDFPTDGVANYAIPGDNPFIGVQGAREEIWAYGLRNPFRDSFDRQTGDLWIGDVGQGAREEINFQPADSTGGENYGWRLREGDIQTPGSVGGPIPPNYVPPVYDYVSNGLGMFGGNSVVGGYVYRGPDPDLQGLYFFGDSFDNTFTQGQLWTFDPADPDGTVQNVESILTPNAGAVNTPVAFGEDLIGNLYLVDRDGDIFRIDTDGAAGILGDYNASGLVEQGDLDQVLANWGQGFASVPATWVNQRPTFGIVDQAELDVVLSNWGSSATPQIGGVDVPEPAALVLWSCAAALATRRRAAS